MVTKSFSDSVAAKTVGKWYSFKNFGKRKKGVYSTGKGPPKKAWNSLPQWLIFEGENPGRNLVRVAMSYHMKE